MRRRALSRRCSTDGYCEEKKEEEVDAGTAMARKERAGGEMHENEQMHKG
jgi:hypothetical protein